MDRGPAQAWELSVDFEGFATVVLRSMADALVYADAAGTIRYWNAAAERMFGFTAAEALGQRLDIIVPEFAASSPLGRLRQDDAHRAQPLWRR